MFACACIAQLEEQTTLNRQVQGSTPCAGIWIVSSVGRAGQFLIVRFRINFLCIY